MGSLFSGFDAKTAVGGISTPGADTSKWDKEIDVEDACLVFDLIHSKDKKAVAAKFELVAVNKKEKPDKGVIVWSTLTNSNDNKKDVSLISRVIYLEKDPGKPEWSIKSGMEFTNKNIKGSDKPITISELTQEEIKIEKCETEAGCKIEEEGSTRIRGIWGWDSNVTKTPSDNFYKVKVNQEENKFGALFNKALDASDVDVTGIYVSDGWKKPNNTPTITISKKLFKDGQPSKGGWNVLSTSTTSTPKKVS